ncbi:MAG: hypothetical protein ABIY55_31075 [Kofleriaceae bacterium]
MLALVLAPSIATASWYRCAYDGATRSECCCPATAHQHQKDAPAPDPLFQAACCCTVTTAVAVAQEAWAAPVPFDLHPSINPIVVTRPVVSGPAISIAMLERPRVDGDPPSSLFARHIALLL